MFYNQWRLQIPPYSLRANSLLSEVAQQVADHLANGGKIKYFPAEPRYSSVEELMESGYRLPKPPNKFKQEQKK